MRYGGCDGTAEVEETFSCLSACPVRVTEVTGGGGAGETSEAVGPVGTAIGVVAGVLAGVLRTVLGVSAAKCSGEAGIAPRALKRARAAARLALERPGVEPTVTAGGTEGGYFKSVIVSTDSFY